MTDEFDATLRPPTVMHTAMNVSGARSLPTQMRAMFLGTGVNVDEPDGSWRVRFVSSIVHESTLSFTNPKTDIAVTPDIASVVLGVVFRMAAKCKEHLPLVREAKLFVVTLDTTAVFAGVLVFPRAIDKRLRPSGDEFTRYRIWLSELGEFHHFSAVLGCTCTKCIRASYEL